MATTKTTKKAPEPNVGMTVANAPLGKEARALGSCAQLGAFMRRLDRLSPGEMLRALIDLGTYVAARRIREGGA